MCTDLALVPKFSRTPLAMEAASPRAHTAAARSRFSSRAAPAAAPTTPVTLLACQPRLWRARAQTRPSLHSTSVAIAKARSTSAPLLPSSSPSASTVGSTAAVGWPRLELEVSSSSSSWPARPLRKAASRAARPGPTPTAVAPPGARRSRAARCTTGVRPPSTMAPTVSRMERLHRASAPGGRGRSSQMKSAKISDSVMA